MAGEVLLVWRYWQVRSKGETDAEQVDADSLERDAG